MPAGACLELMLGGYVLGLVKSQFKEATTIMYLPMHFTETDARSITGLIAEFALSTLVAGIGDGVADNHLPLLLLGEDRLVGHVALASIASLGMVRR